MCLMKNRQNSPRFEGATDTRLPLPSSKIGCESSEKEFCWILRDEGEGGIPEVYYSTILLKWALSYSFGLDFYLKYRLGAWNCHGQAGELKKKRPQHQHAGRQGGPPRLSYANLSCWGVIRVSTKEGRMCGCLWMLQWGPICLATGRSGTCLLQSGSLAFVPLTDCSGNPWTQGSISAFALT